MNWTMTLHIVKLLNNDIPLYAYYIRDDNQKVLFSGQGSPERIIDVFQKASKKLDK